MEARRRVSGPRLGRRRLNGSRLGVERASPGRGQRHEADKPCPEFSEAGSQQQTEQETSRATIDSTWLLN